MPYHNFTGPPPKTERCPEGDQECVHSKLINYCETREGSSIRVHWQCPQETGWDSLEDKERGKSMDY